MALCITLLNAGPAPAGQSAGGHASRLLAPRARRALAVSQTGSAGTPLAITDPVDCATFAPPVVGFEISRGQDPNDMAGLLNDLSADGFSVGTVDMSAGPIPPCVDVLIVVGLLDNLALLSAYTAADGALLQGWTASGRGLMLFSDWGFLKHETQALFQAFGHTVLGTDTSVVSDPTDFDPAGLADTWVIYQSDNFGAHPALDGIASLELLRSSWFTPSASSLVTTDADASPPGVAVLAAALHQTGCVFLSADSNWAAEHDGAYSKEDNSQAARQVVGWLNGCGGLALSKTAAPNPVQPSQHLTYTLTATNHYTAPLTSVVITEVTPAGTAFVSATPPFTGPDANGVVTWALGPLGLSASAVVTMAVRADAGLADGAVIANTAQVSSAEGFTDTAAALVTVSVPVPSTIFVPLLSKDYCSPPAPPIVYSSDFEGAVGIVWSKPVTDVTPTGRRFLGQFGTEAVSLSLVCLPPHASVTVAFDLYVLRSWDGNIVYQPSDGSVVGPDIWELAEGGTALLRTTFSNWTFWPDFEFRQAYPGAYPGGDFLPRTGASENDSLGYLFNGEPMDSVYRLEITFPHSAESVVLDFSVSGQQPLEDESWGIDNLEVTVGP